MEQHLKIIGWLLILLSLLHAIFPQYFNWKTELVKLSLVNRQMILVHTLFIALTILLMGLLCISSYEEILHTKLGNKIVLGLGIFWTTRLIIQFFGFSSKLWKGKTFETTVHVLFSFLWLYLSVVFLYIYWDGAIEL